VVSAEQRLRGDNRCALSKRVRTANRRVVRLILLLVAAVAGVLLSQSNAVAAEKEVRRVLVFYELGLSSPAVSLLDEQIRLALENSPFQIELYREYLETTLFPDPDTQQEFREWYIRKYRNRRPDLIIALGPSSLRFLVDSHEQFFREIPVVFGGTPEELADNLKLDSHFTGVWEKFEPAKTLEIALRLLPGTKRVVVVGGMSAFDKRLEAIFRNNLRSYENRLDFTYLTDLEMPTLRDRLRHLPPDTVILYTHIGQDAAGTRFVGAAQADPMVASAANAPIFGPSDVDLGHGEVGGDLQSFAREGKLVGETALRVLARERPQDIPVVRGANVNMFDWRALKRWGLRERHLPPGSIVLNRQPTFWESYKWYIIGSIHLIVLETLLILGLTWQRARRRKTEAELRSSEEKFSKCFRQSPLAITIFSISGGRYIEVNPTFERQTGWKRDEVIGRSPSDIHLWLDPSQRSLFIKHLLTEGKVQDFEVRFRTKDARIRTALGSADLININGEPCALSVVADITERKEAEEALARLSGRLIEAQEKERQRIARELHDDYNQRLAMLAIDLERLSENIGGPSGEAGPQLHDFFERVSNLSADLHSLSHSLHSSTLESLGLVAGVKAFCQEFAEQQGIQVDFAHENVPRGIPGDAALCIFRIAQEALRNIKRHSGANRAKVRLEWSGERLHLLVSDRGRGFSPNKLSPNSGIGIQSMEERLRLLGGQLELHSQPMEGTTIDAWLPFKIASQCAS
jgi:PAS domain S-box-containing protein